MPGNKGSVTQQRLHVRDLLGFIRFTRDYRRDYVFMLFFLVLQMASYQLLAYSLKYLINDLIPMKRVDYLMLYLGSWVITFFLHSVVTLMAARFRIIIVRSLTANVRSEIIRKLQTLSIRYFDTRGTGTTSAKLLMDVERMQGFFDWMMVALMQAVFGLILVIPLLSTINVKLTLITILYVPTIPLLQQVFRDRLTRRSYELRNTSARLSEKLIDFISGLKLIRMFASEDEQSARILQEVRSMRNVEIHYTITMRIFGMAIQFFGEFMPILLWVVAGVLMVKDDGLTVGEVVAYIALVHQMLGSMHILFSSFDQVVAASPSVAAILEILRSNEIENQSPKITEFTLGGRVEFRGVDFRYETPAGTRQLKGINLTIEPGEKVALVGESGSGKSTFVNAMLGLYPIASGEILFDGKDIRDLSLKRLRSQIAIMSQDTFLFNTSLHDNIRFARLTATPEEIESACRKAEIYDHITSLPQGFDTCAGERGVTLSGGQRQRIGMARVFLREPTIIVLDEPSSALDVFTEQRLFDTLYRNIDGKTLIVIAHRLSTIKSVDRVFVFSGGAIVEQGRFDELSRRDGYFSRMLRASA